MASKVAKGKRKAKQQPNSEDAYENEISIPESEVVKKRSRKRQPKNDGEVGPVNTGTKVKPETSLNETGPAELVKKRLRKALNKKESERLFKSLNDVDISILSGVIQQKISEQCLSERFEKFVDVLYKNERLFQDILLHHRLRFPQLYMECKKGGDAFLRFQLQWHQHCSAFLLSRSYPLTSINLDESVQHTVAALRMQWLDFCDINGLPVPDSNVVMMTISSAIYELLLEQTESFKNSLTTDHDITQISIATDGDDVYFRFGGAALCDMLHLRYQQIKNCTDMQRDKLSQEITVLQAMNMKDKTNLPQYLQYRDRGFMYFPDFSFIPFLRTIDETVKEIINMNSLEKDGSDLIKVRYTVCFCNCYVFFFRQHMIRLRNKVN